MATTAKKATTGTATDREFKQDIFSKAFAFNGLQVTKFFFHNDLMGDWDGANPNDRFFGITFALDKDGKSEEFGYALSRRDVFPIIRDGKPVIDVVDENGKRVRLELTDDLHRKAFELLTDGVKRQESEAFKAVVDYMNEALPATIKVESAWRLSKKGNKVEFPFFCFNRKK